jgi:hypothetical protein
MHAPEATRTYFIDEATLQLPLTLKDKSIQILALESEGPSEFSVVITRVDLEPDASLEGMVARLLAELTGSLPGFHLVRRYERMIGRSSAVDLYYTWKKDSVTLHQRQAITFVQSPTSTTTPQALLIAATCIGDFPPRWADAYEVLMSSFELRRPWPPRR